MSVAETSMLAYAELKAQRQLQPMEQRVLNCITHQPRTRDDIAWLTGMRLSSVCGRVASLKKAGLVKVLDVVESLETGKKQQLISLTFSEDDVCRG